MLSCSADITWRHAARFRALSLRCLLPRVRLVCRRVPLVSAAYNHARYWGIVSGTSKARAAFRASKAAASVPGSVLAYAVYVQDESQGPQDAWAQVAFESVLAPAQPGVWAWLGHTRRQLRGWYEPRLQARMAAAGSRDARDVQLLASLTSRVLEVGGRRE